MMKETKILASVEFLELKNSEIKKLDKLNKFKNKKKIKIYIKKIIYY